jgi:hypothetical protein
MLPNPITHISSFASLNRDYLAPKDTINAIIKSGDANGTFFLSFGSPSSKYDVSENGYSFSGPKGWITVGSAGEEKPGHGKITVTDKEGKKEVIHVRNCGVEVECKNFFEALRGKDGGEQNPRSALKDVAFIQAALDSNGQLVDLQALSKA